MTVAIPGTPADRVAAVHRYGTPAGPAVTAQAVALLEALLAAAAEHGVTLADFDGVIDLPGGCLDVMVGVARQAERDAERRR
ncbi:hypothetical protein J7F02_28380 [Streptomyces sp. ISL-112]|uniref:hypothetical protein n=1 Tax=unclassified Streptomyces TaxID=2593676 RepID=UPI001BE7ADCE|nr:MULTISPECIES: hypothetical protein [unclassified Streptomyces]MBT2429428.1 hypothetical protein [Streptomyces sp. ISL-112]MBT2464020.1 hypothetical protein [Streptomyces sp. ISL-63]